MLQLIFAPCLILPEVSSGAMFTMATYASTLGIAAILSSTSVLFGA
jgi:hypothetical protein